MELDLRLTTVLSAVNNMLGLIGGTEVNSVEDIQDDLEAFKAFRILQETSMHVQYEGWHFNTYQDYEMVRNVDDEVVLSDNVLKIISSDSNNAYVERGRKLYDLKENTFKFEVNPTVSLTELLQFEELPQSARYYIVMLASQKFQMDIEGTTSNMAYSDKEIQRARVILENEDSQVYKYNMFRDIPDLNTLTSR